MALRSLTCYPVPGKRKSADICDAFLQGWRTTAEQDSRRHSFFFGVVEGNRRQFDNARRNLDANWYYGDNSYFDAGREKYFRVSVNCFQESRLLPPDHRRLEQLGVRIRPWSVSGRHVLIVEQSPAFMELVGDPGWLGRTVAALRKHTDRELRIRHWDRDKVKLVRSLPQDLAGAWALVTHSSAAAVTAVLGGVAVFTTAPCGASPMGVHDALSLIEQPERPEAREEWAAGLAARQWTLDEFRKGMVWEVLKA